MNVLLGLIMSLFISSEGLAWSEQDISRRIVDLTSGDNPFRSAAVIYFDGGTTKFHSAGQDGIAEDSIVEIGSNSKVFTGMLLAIAVTEGRLSLESSPNEAFGEALFPEDIDRHLQFMHLANHTSGLPRLPDNLPSQDMDDPYKGFDLNLMKEYARSLTYRDPMPETCVPSYVANPEDMADVFGKTVRLPGCYNYSNIGSAVLGHAVASALGSPYEQVLRERILRPLGLSDTDLSVLDPARRVQGYVAGGSPARGWSLGAIAPAGGIKSTPSDMMKFLKAFLEAHRSGDQSEMGKAKRLTTSKVSGVDAGTGQVFVGLGWHRELSEAGNPIFWHNGGTDGFLTFMAIDPETNRAVFLVANQVRETPDGHLDDRLTKTGFAIIKASSSD